VSVTDLEARFEVLSSDTAGQLATFSVALEHQRKELGGTEFLPTDRDLQTCILKASSHVARLEKLQEKWTQMQAVQGSNAEQFQDVVRDAVLQCTQDLLQSQKELRAVPQSSEPSTRTSTRISLHVSGSDAGVGQISQTSGKDVSRNVHSSGNHFARKPGIVNSRIQHFEGRIQEVEGKATMPDGMQRIALLDVHLPPPQHFHAVQQAAPPPCGTSTSHVAAMSQAWPSHAIKVEQSLSSYGQTATESGGGSTCAWQPQLCLTQPNAVRLSFSPVPTPRSPPPLFLYAGLP